MSSVQGYVCHANLLCCCCDSSRFISSYLIHSHVGLVKLPLVPEGEIGVVTATEVGIGIDTVREEGTETGHLMAAGGVQRDLFPPRRHPRNGCRESKTGNLILM